MALRPSLNFAGNAGEVLAHYRAALGGEAFVMRFAGSQAAEFVPPDWGDKVLFARLTTPYGEIDMMDAPPGRESPTGGNVAVAIDLADDEQGARIFAKLAEGGTVMMPYEQTFFARRFGMTNDKFGVRWMISVGEVVVTPA